MIKIGYTNEPLVGVPGPNFFWSGDCHDFLKLCHDLHPLGQRNGMSLSIHELYYIQVVGELGCIGDSVTGGNYLLKKTNNIVEISLDVDVWRRFLGQCYHLSFQPSHVILNFDGFNLQEDANFIISSEIDQLGLEKDNF